MVNRKTWVAAAYLALALALLAGLFASQTFPPLILFVVFAIPHVWLDLHAVEVNDKLRLSGSVMVLMSAGTVFGSGSAILGMACVAALWPFVPEDFSERRVFFPVVNFAQILVSAAAAGAVVELLSPEVSTSPRFLLASAGVAILAALVFALVGSIQVRWLILLAFGRKQMAPWTHLGQLFASFSLLGAIGGMLGATLLMMDSIVLLPVFFVIYLIGQLSFQSYADLQEAHDSTVQGFIKTLEAKDMFVHGHTARVASFANMIGSQLGFAAERMERIRWAALMHDVGAIAVPRDLLRNRRGLTDEEQAQLLASMVAVERELSESDFLKPMMDRAARLRVRFSEAEKDEITADAQILAVAKWFDSVTNTRTQGQSLTQERALAQLRAESPYRYDPEVVTAFETALRDSGFEYGAVEFDGSRTPEDYAKEAMYDR